jgi:hypothetical protein
MKTAVDSVFVGKNRLYNRRFLQMCSHYLVEAVAWLTALLRLILVAFLSAFVGQQAFKSAS